MNRRFATLTFHGLRLGFRLLPLRQATRDRWRQRFLDRHGGLVPEAPRGRMVVGTPRRHTARKQTGGPAIGFVPPREGSVPDAMPATLVAFYLPQFHPIPENDAWWGEGFTEWRNVARALPQFEGHAQPRLPGALGFYDLRQGDAMRKQMQLARAYGIGAFCSYFYWFAGKTLLEQPLRQWLEDASLDLPMCLCWANENWTRRWDGRADEILIAQQHSAEDDLAFIAHVGRYLADPRYLRVDGKPLLVVYRAGLLPDAAATAQRWRQWCREHAIGEIYLACVQGFERIDPRTIGFNAAIEFPPNLATPTDISARQRLLNPDFRGQVLDWRAMAREIAARPMPDYPLFPGVNTSWDNEPRRSGRGRIYAHASPRAYRDWLQATLEHRASTLPPSQRLVFVNAWNEWAEGAVLEPDARLGHAWLQATRDALNRAARSVVPVDTRPCAIVHAWYVDLLDEIIAALRASGIDWRLIVTTTHDRAQTVRQRLDALDMPATIEAGENRGRDILPFLRVADRLLNEGSGMIVKLHTKRSTHRRDGDAWRHELLDRLLAPKRVRHILDAFAGDPALGLVAPEGHVQPLHYYWGANRDNVDYLATRLGIPAPDVEHERFIAGSMFWARPAALRPLLDAHLDPWEFEDEAHQVDGTFAHAIERIVAVSAQAAGYYFATTASLCGDPEPSVAYPYAHRDA